MAKGKEKDTTRRRSAREIFTAVVENARTELARPSVALLFSGFAGGLSMGLTGLGVALLRGYLGAGAIQEIAANLFYPIGFIVVIIGRAQLFTENTLYPVVLVLDDGLRHLPNTLRLWGLVFLSNVLGAWGFAALIIKTGALEPRFSQPLVALGTRAVGGNFGHLFWSGVIGGWIIALVAWMVTASHWTIGQLTVTWLLTFLVGAGNFAHCVATSGEILSAVVAGNLRYAQYLDWLLPATLGNIVGGVVIVSLLNYGQVKIGESEPVAEKRAA